MSAPSSFVPASSSASSSSAASASASANSSSSSKRHAKGSGRGKSHHSNGPRASNSNSGRGGARRNHGHRNHQASRGGRRGGGRGDSNHNHHNRGARHGGKAEYRPKVHGQNEPKAAPKSREEAIAHVKALSEKRRFEAAANELRKHNLLNDAQALNQFLATLIGASQYRLAFNLVEKSSAVACAWTPHAIVNAMISTGHFDQALRYIEKYRLGSAIEPQSIIEKILRRGDVRLALPHIKIFCLEHIYTPGAMIEQCVQQCEWDMAIKLLRDSRQHDDFKAISAKFPPENLIERMIKARDWVAALRFLHQFGYGVQLVEDDEDLVEERESDDAKKKEPIKSHQSLYIDLIKGLVADRQLYIAMRCVLKYRLESEFPLATVLAAMVQTNQFQFAIRFSKLLHMEHVLDGDARQRIHWERLKMMNNYRALAGRLSAQLRESRQGKHPDIMTTKAIYLGFSRYENAEFASPLKRANSDDDDSDDDDDLLLPKPSPAAPPRAAAASGRHPMMMPGYGARPGVGHPFPPRGIPMVVRPGMIPHPQMGPPMGMSPVGPRSPFLPRQHNMMGLPPRPMFQSPRPMWGPNHPGVNMNAATMHPMGMARGSPSRRPQPQPQPANVKDASAKSRSAKKDEAAVKAKKKQSGPLMPVQIMFK